MTVFLTDSSNNGFFMHFGFARLLRGPPLGRGTTNESVLLNSRYNFGEPIMICPLNSVGQSVRLLI